MDFFKFILCLLSLYGFSLAVLPPDFIAFYPFDNSYIGYAPSCSLNAASYLQQVSSPIYNFPNNAGGNSSSYAFTPGINGNCVTAYDGSIRLGYFALGPEFTISFWVLYWYNGPNGTYPSGTQRSTSFLGNGYHPQSNLFSPYPRSSTIEIRLNAVGQTAVQVALQVIDINNPRISICNARIQFPVTAAVAATTPQWFHVIATYSQSAQVATIYLNGTATSTSFNQNFSSTAVPYDASWRVFGNPAGPEGTGFGLSVARISTMDNLIFYNRSLNSSEAQDLYNALQPGLSLLTNPTPVSGGTNTSVSIVPNNPTNLTISGIDNTNTTTVSWYLPNRPTAGCTFVNLSNVVALNTIQVSFPATFGDYAIVGCASIPNTIGVVGTQFDFSVFPFAPSFINNINPNTDGTAGQTLTLTVNVSGAPTPTFQWQELVPITVSNLSNNPDLLKRSIHELSEDDIEYFYDINCEQGGIPFDYNKHLLMMSLKLSHLSKHKQQRQTTANNNSSSSSIENGTTSLWVNLVNADGNSYTTRRLNMNDTGKQLRVQVSNSVDTVYSQATVIRVLPAPIATYQSSSDKVVGPVVGSIVGAVILCLLLCLCCFIILFIILIRKGVIRKKKTAKLLREPNYEGLAYGNYQNEKLYTITGGTERDLSELETLVIHDDYFLLALTISESSEITPDAIKSLAWLFQYHHKGTLFLQTLIEREVETSNSEATLFRANSSACTFYTTWVRTFGIPYIWSTLVVPVNELNDNARRKEDDEDQEGGYELKTKKGYSPSSYNAGSSSSANPRQVLTMDSMEVDPLKMGDKEAADRTVNNIQLWLVAQKLFSAILKSKQAVPHEVRSILKFVKAIVKEKFGKDAAFRGMGAFMFLRYICPSLLAPHQWGLLDEAPHATSQRQLILLGKVIQNLANGTLPGSKEEYMEKLNEFIVMNQIPLVLWYKDVVNSEGQEVGVEVPQEVRRNALITVYEFIVKNRKDLEESLVENFEKGDEMVDKLRTALQKEAVIGFLKSKE